MITKSTKKINSFNSLTENISTNSSCTIPSKIESFNSNYYKLMELEKYTYYDYSSDLSKISLSNGNLHIEYYQTDIESNGENNRNLLSFDYSNVQYLIPYDLNEWGSYGTILYAIDNILYATTYNYDSFNGIIGSSSDKIYKVNNDNLRLVVFDGINYKFIYFYELVPEKHLNNLIYMEMNHNELLYYILKDGSIFFLDSLNDSNYMLGAEMDIKVKYIIWYNDGVSDNLDVNAYVMDNYYLYSDDLDIIYDSKVTCVDVSKDGYITTVYFEDGTSMVFNDK